MLSLTYNSNYPPHTPAISDTAIFDGSSEDIISFSNVSSSWVTTVHNNFGENWHFVEWNTSYDGTGTSYNPGDTISTNITVYAIWSGGTELKPDKMDITHNGTIYKFNMLTDAERTKISQAITQPVDSSDNGKVLEVVNGEWGKGVKKIDNKYEKDDPYFVSSYISGLPAKYDGAFVWTDGENIYYSASGYQYVLNKETGVWNPKSWLGYALPEGSYIWTDGENIYHSVGTSHYILDKATSTWNRKTWNGLSSLSASNIWTDGENIYYSNSSSQYVLDKATSTWSKKIWNGYTQIFGEYIWSDGENVYYSNSTTQYVLDKETSTWSAKTWNNLTLFYGSDIWTDDENIYYSRSNNQYVLNKSTSTWSAKTWTGLTTFAGSNVWTDGENIYCSYGETQYVFNKSTSGWSSKSWTDPVLFDSTKIWSDGVNTYYSDGTNKQYVFDKSTLTWNHKTWNGLTNFTGSNIWTDGENIYYSSSTVHYVLNKATYTWTTVSWNGVSNFNGQNIWTDGTNIYYSNGATQYVLDKSTSTWSTKTWVGLTNLFSAASVWTDGEDFYLGNGGSHNCILNKTTQDWVDVTWDWRIPVKGEGIWTDGEDIYYRNLYKLIPRKYNAKILLGENGEFSPILVEDLPGVLPEFESSDNEKVLQIINNKPSWQTPVKDIQEDGTSILENGTANIQTMTGASASGNGAKGLVPTPINGDQDKCLKGDGTWGDMISKQYAEKAYDFVPTMFNGLDINLGGGYVWTDGENVYYSQGAAQYILDKVTSTWTVKIWSGLYSFDGLDIWSDGEYIYYSHESTKQYVLDKETSTWNTKEWNGYTQISGAYIWSDGENIYYSRSDNQYVLNKSTSTWNAKTWTGLTTFMGNYVWTDGENVYYSNSSSQYVLDKATSTWSKKTWTGLTSFIGNYVWTDGDNIYYSASGTNKVLDKATSTWNTKTWNWDTTSMSIQGNCCWADEASIYYSNGSNQYILDKTTSTWSAKTWIGGPSSFNPAYVWSDGDNIYYSFASTQLVFDKSTLTWSPKTWVGLTSSYGYNIWTDGDNIYYSSSTIQKVLDKLTSTWDDKTWNGLSSFYGSYVWSDGENIYYSNGNDQYVLDKTTSTWSTKTWSGSYVSTLTGNKIWSDGTNFYSSSNAAQTVLNKSTSYWTTKSWTGGLSYPNGNNIWSDGDNIYHSDSGVHYQFNKTTLSWSLKTWNGPAPYSGEHVWTDGSNIYNKNNSRLSHIFETKILLGENGEFVPIPVDDLPGTLPAVSSSDNGKVLKVVEGEPSWQESTGAVTDVQEDGTSILNNGVANILTMTGASSSVAGSKGLVPAPAAGDDDKFLAGDGTYKSGGKPMVILSYGSSTWADFEAAYNNNVIVYCRASSNANPATGTQGRMAFMAFLNFSSGSPSSVEFQYYRSVSSHSASQMGDQVFIYKLDKTSGWSVTVREASSKIVAGTGLNGSYSNDVYTITNAHTTMTGASSSVAGTGGLVPAPSAGANTLYLCGDGTWSDPPGGKLYVLDLDTVTNTSGSYTHSTTASWVTSEMKPVGLEVGNSSAFDANITVTPGNGTVTLACANVAGTSTVRVWLQYVGTSGSINSTEFDTLAGRIGVLNNLTTTAKTDLVAAVNEVDGDVGALTSLTTTTKSSLVAAVNEVDGDVGLLSNLTTTAKTNLVGAVNEVNGYMGLLSNLTTTVKTNLVNAVNEVKSGVTTNSQAIARQIGTSSISNANDATTEGVYTAGYAATNMPFSGYWSLEVRKYSTTGDLIQKATNVQSRQEYVRTRDNGTWTSWLAYEQNRAANTSTTSFQALDPYNSSSNAYMGGALDKVKTNIASYTDSQTFYVSNGGPVYGGVLVKVSASYFCGIVFSYHDSAKGTVWLFAYNNGTYSLRPLAGEQ